MGVVTTWFTCTRIAGAFFLILSVFTYFYFYDIPKFVYPTYFELEKEEEIFMRYPRFEPNHYICGDFFEKISDFQVTDRHPETCKRLHNFRPPFDSVPIFFIKTDFLDVFTDCFQEINKNRIRYIMITHNSDYSIPGSYAAILEDPLLVRWYGQNTENFHPKLSVVPIGLANEVWEHGKKAVVARVASRKIKPIRHRTVGVYVNWGDHTNAPARKAWRAWFCKENELFGDFKTKCKSVKQHSPMTTADFERYLNEVGDSIFVASPPGNGIDCLRTWEALAIGAIPIVTNTSIAEVYRDERILVVNDLSEITPTLLHDYLDQHEADMPSKKLFGEYWLLVIDAERQRAKKDIVSKL